MIDKRNGRKSIGDKMKEIHLSSIEKNKQASVFELNLQEERRQSSILEEDKNAFQCDIDEEDEDDEVGEDAFIDEVTKLVTKQGES
jgi:hypothetical protein